MHRSIGTATMRSACCSRRSCRRGDPETTQRTLVPIVFECGIVLLLILLNAFFAMSERAIVSSHRPRLQKLAERGHRGATLALKLSEDPTQFLSAVQIGITLIGIVAGAYSGATLAEPFAAYL